jgi:Gluconate 2-dehydrogenase subunit 3
MKRRKFIQTMAAAPALAVPATAAPAQQNPQARQAPEITKLETSISDVAAAYTPKFFTTLQFSALRKLSAILMPALGNNPGALEAEAPEFLDFLIGQSPAERQQIYRAGLDILNAQAMKQFKKNFADVDETQANTLLAPLRIAWTYNPPTEPLARFLRDAKADVRTATMNSREWNTAGGKRTGVGQYWYPID